MTPDVNVVLLDFPAPGNEMVFENEDDSFTIMINARLSYDEQLKAYRHAMRHIGSEEVTGPSPVISWLKPLIIQGFFVCPD